MRMAYVDIASAIANCVVAAFNRDLVQVTNATRDAFEESEKQIRQLDADDFGTWRAIRSLNRTRDELANRLNVYRTSLAAICDPWFRAGGA